MDSSAIHARCRANGRTNSMEGHQTPVLFGTEHRLTKRGSEARWIDSPMYQGVDQISVGDGGRRSVHELQFPQDLLGTFQISYFGRLTPEVVFLGSSVEHHRTCGYSLLTWMKSGTKEWSWK